MYILYFFYIKVTTIYYYLYSVYDMLSRFISNIFIRSFKKLVMITLNDYSIHPTKTTFRHDPNHEFIIIQQGTYSSWFLLSFKSFAFVLGFRVEVYIWLLYYKFWSKSRIYNCEVYVVLC